ncbi:PKAR [Candida jiufengensis]|uniref:PKAR n=1 Tax=Candida jiufengensis TaxID=497108 RepID=UPI002224E9C4|nr:PKAR [Candida jiufengensis]KAI5951995.1 PKAR [Candida jiufengensis]
MSNQLVTEELSQLQREILAKNPQDVVQFCANYFNNKLQSQRSNLWSQQSKAKEAGIDLFPSTSIVDNREPSFKSPFGANDPHGNKSESTTSKSGVFKSNYNVNETEQAPPTKEIDPDSKVPKTFNINRRTSVSAEALNPAKLKSESWKPPQNNLSTTEEESLANSLQNNFLFKQLDDSSKKTVISALQSKNFKKDSIIIKQGDEGDFFYIIESGIVDFYVNDSKVNSSGDGSSFGELALMYNSPRAATAIAASDVTVWALDRLTFRRILLEGTFNRRLMYEDFLKDIEILKSLTDQERSKLADALSTEMYHNGDKIVVEGEKGENFYLIESGSCQVYNEKLGEIKKLGKGDYFGELALIKELPRQATVQALDNVIVATLGKSGFQRLLGPVVDVLKDKDPTKVQDPTIIN